ncbi:lysylphosphatidylglycerol synthase transmembrane domain-containing protein [Blastococcus sp. URHD0036]|uniref:lysylphosphatidylglycerol synthase transmembrane domain-containing protein n=1 Tax=Blastococcus sp. URHD0036 TaxID=1380356 RepID=UPI0012DD96BC|nr:lysylphosphatidylglycerol synthase transmembrane domain-containing protein [Blastococcus sp. URHD0036]
MGNGEPGSFWPSGRVRRPADVGRLCWYAGGLLGLVLLSVLVPGATDAVVPPGLRGLPRGVVAVVNGAASLTAIAALLGLAVDALRHRRYALTTAGLAGLLAAAVAVAAEHAGQLGWIAVLGPADRPAVIPISVGIAVVIGSDRSRSARLTLLALGALATMTGCALALSSLTVAGAVAAVLIGAGAGFGVRVAVGVVPARPAEEEVRAVLARAGVEVDALRMLQVAAGRARYTARDDAGEVLVTVVDPDRRGVTVARRLWRVLRFRTPAVGRPALSLRGVLERQALVTALAGAAGVPVPRVQALLAAGPALVLVERPLGGMPLLSASVRDEALAGAFGALRRLHDAGIAHGALSERAVVLLPDGAVGLGELQYAQPAAGELQRDLDVVALLVAVAAREGVDRAVAALRCGYAPGPADTDRIVGLLQPLALVRPVRRSVSGTPVLEDLRAALSPPDRGRAVPAQRLERVRLRTLVSVAGGTVAAIVLASQLSEVPLGAALRQARPGWLVVALLGSALTYVGAGLALQAFIPTRVPFVRTCLVQLASSFVTLVTPPTVGHVGLNIRYLQRAGIPTASAAATVGVGQVVTVGGTLLLLVVAGWLSGVSPSQPSLLPSGNVLAVLLVAAGIVAVALAVPGTRRTLRARVEPLLRRTIPQLLAALTDPRRLGTALSGVVLQNAGYVIALDASLRAFGTSLDLPALVVVYLVASTVGSAAPTPGGLGAVEAALVAGLTATGVPLAAALTAVLAFRAATFWVPAPVGWVAFTVLQRRDRI